MKTITFLAAALLAATTAQAAPIASKLMPVDDNSSIIIMLSDQTVNYKCDGVSGAKLAMIQHVTRRGGIPLTTFKGCYMREGSDLNIVYWNPETGDGSTVQMAQDSFDKLPAFDGFDAIQTSSLSR